MFSEIMMGGMTMPDKLMPGSELLGKEKILAIDIGGGTQDILLYDPEKTVENCYKLVLPSPTVVVAQQIRQVTQQQKALYLGGNLMGGGPVVRAVREHLEQGLPVYANADAARTLNDDLDKVRAMGVCIEEVAPSNALTVEMGDLQLRQLDQALAQFGVELPNKVAVAAQDHGESLGMSNRKFRFELWREFLEQGGSLQDLVYHQVPKHFTRLAAIQQAAPGTIMMDTGSAAVWGALCDPQVAKHREQGLMVVNIGNQHTLAFLIQGERIWGVFEHHTKKLSAGEIEAYVQGFLRGQVTNEEVFNSSGHGCWTHPQAPQFSKNTFIAVTGPNRGMLQATDWYQAAPYGDMMLAGCFGLIAGATGGKKQI